MEKDGDGSFGYFGRWKKVKMGFQGQLQRYLRRYLFFFPSLLFMPYVQYTGLCAVCFHSSQPAGRSREKPGPGEGPRLAEPPSAD